MKGKTKNLALCGLCAALTCVLAPLSIPIGQVPISLATFAVMLSAALLGAKWGVLSQVVYLLLGCIGVPVFAGFSAGVGCIAGPTGGYLLGYLVLAAAEGLLYHLLGSGKRMGKKSAALVVSMLVGTAALYTLGSCWFILVTHTPLQAALLTCVVPFLPGDAVKIAAVTVLVPQLERALGHLDHGRQTA
ncbi:MAG: biotin transporter BioY [Oscillospiraceae bacterium]|jgi:biotin transport system substrate-specific component|nr:biotin transporter BioY [Oscillospiraceae bacterium]MDD3260601.1 biotin transporter BioY [Oscillospiraceae bacterium]